MKNKVYINNKINKFDKKIYISGDKSISIRSVLLASQAVGVSRIYNILESEDVINTLKSIRKLGIGARHDYNRSHLRVSRYGKSRSLSP